MPVYCPSSVRLLPTDSSLLTPSSHAVLSSSLSSLSTYPRRLRRDGPIFSSRFLGSNIFYTFFLSLPSPTAAHAPLSLPPAIGISPRASTPSPSLSHRTYAHGLSLSLSPSRPVYPPPFFLLSFVHLSLPSHLSFIFPCLSLLPLSLLSLSPLPLFYPYVSYLFDFFFTATRPPTDAARRRPFSIGTLFSTIGSTTYSRIHVRSQPQREREKRRDKEGRKEGACGCGRKRRTEGCMRRGTGGGVSGWRRTGGVGVGGGRG